MSITIRTESPLGPDSRRLIAASEAALRAVYPPEACCSMSPEELAAPNVQFLVARVDGQALGCVALVDQGSYGEVKRLYVAPEARGLGLARALMAELEEWAMNIGLTRLCLETGDALAEASGLYRSIGFRERRRFGTYSDTGASLFMEKPMGVFAAVS